MRIFQILTLSLMFAATSVLNLNAQKEPDSEEPLPPPTYKYRIQLTDKKHNPYSLRRPEEFLSYKSIQRRRHQHIKLDKTDLPVTPQYVEQIRAIGVGICSTSKWNNTVLVETGDLTLIERIAQLPFVSDTLRVATYRKPRSADPFDRASFIGDEAHNRPDFRVDPDADLTNPDYARSYYGRGFEQINQLNLQSLHQKGFRGQGMTIAIIDGGFYNADIIPMLGQVRVLGTRDFVEPDNSVYGEESHGMMVLSCIAANTPGQFVGTAPEASFWLLRSEDGDSEQPVEEDNWAAAVEFADSVGADVVNTSLGYSKYDRPADKIKYYEMDGHTRLASRTASMMASKGMVLCNSAGNEGDDHWKLISVPADADDVLTVGALTPEGENTLFSSLGNTADGRIKPDVMAMGQNCTVYSIRGTITQANGTSFASPIMCGAVACFWQANPHLTALQVVKAVRALGNNTAHPDNVYGYGTPDFSK